jgi:rhomboid protease GluP
LSNCPICGADNLSDASFCKSCGSPLQSGTASKPDDEVKKCAYCAKPLTGEDAYYFRCRYCGQDFCYEHRLPENHLCKSSPLRRNIPSSASYYTTSGGGYYSTSGSARGSSTSSGSGGGFSINVSKQGRNLAIAILAGLLIGFIFNFIWVSYPPSAPYFQGGIIPITYLLVQLNGLVYTGWIVPIFTSMIVVLPDYSGLLDVAFNAFAVIWLDGILRASYSPRQYYMVFILTGVAGNLLSLAFYPALTISFGASGGIFGLLAGALTVDYARNGRFNRSLVTFFLFIFVISTISGGVDVFAHLGGALIGLVAGYVIGKSRMK